MSLATVYDFLNNCLSNLVSGGVIALGGWAARRLCAKKKPAENATGQGFAWPGSRRRAPRRRSPAECDQPCDEGPAPS